MKGSTVTPSALIIGKSEVVLAETIALLRGQGYRADATHRFDDVGAEFDLGHYDVVVFGGQVPADTRDRLAAEIKQLNGAALLVDGLAGIPGLIAAQVDGALSARLAGPEPAPSFDPDGRTIALSLPGARTVTVTAWWGTSFVPPDPKSDSLILIDHQRLDGQQAIPLPPVVPHQAAFVTVRLDDVTHALSVATSPRAA
jgi:hypothetical protein